VVQPAEDRYSLDTADGLRRPTDRLPLCEALMRACLVEEMYERGDEAPEVLLLNDKDETPLWLGIHRHVTQGRS
jgi:hypothetical protein